MHLAFDKIPDKPEEQTVQDESGNRNDAGLANGAEISNRTMGMHSLRFERALWRSIFEMPPFPCYLDNRKFQLRTPS